MCLVVKLSCKITKFVREKNRINSFINKEHLHFVHLKIPFLELLGPNCSQKFRTKQQTCLSCTPLFPKFPNFSKIIFPDTSGGCRNDVIVRKNRRNYKLFINSFSCKDHCRERLALLLQEFHDKLNKFKV